MQTLPVLSFEKGLVSARFPFPVECLSYWLESGFVCWFI